mgnify:CR=1 FL=1
MAGVALERSVYASKEHVGQSGLEKELWRIRSHWQEEGLPHNWYDLPKTGFMTVKMAKDAANAIASDILGKPLLEPSPLDVVCLLDLGKTAAMMKAKPIYPPRQESTIKQGIYYKWLKAGFEKYFLWKTKHGMITYIK